MNGHQRTILRFSFPKATHFLEHIQRVTHRSLVSSVCQDGVRTLLKLVGIHIGEPKANPRQLREMRPIPVDQILHLAWKPRNLPELQRSPDLSGKCCFFSSLFARTCFWVHQRYSETHESPIKTWVQHAIFSGWDGPATHLPGF